MVTTPTRGGVGSRKWQDRHCVDVVTMCLHRRRLTNMALPFVGEGS